MKIYFGLFELLAVEIAYSSPVESFQVVLLILENFVAVVDGLGVLLVVEVGLGDVQSENF